MSLSATGAALPPPATLPLPRWHRGQEPPLTHRTQCPPCSLSNPLGAPEPSEHKPPRNSNLRMVFRPPQRTVRKLWLLAYMDVAKLSLNQRQRLKIFLQAKSLLFSKSPSKDQKLQLLNLIHTE